MGHTGLGKMGAPAAQMRLGARRLKGKRGQKADVATFSWLAETDYKTRNMLEAPTT
jgi:hypothetical protein